MSYRIRLQSTEAFQHITARGNNKQDFFFEPQDREVYLDLMAAAAIEFHFEIHAFCLMSNHVHWLAHFLELNMPEVIKSVHGRYARLFNRKYARVGHVFQRRYDNTLVETDEHLLEAGRYIHMNPVKERMCAAPEDYPWSSFREYWTERHVLTRPESPLVSSYRRGERFDRAAFKEFTMERQELDQEMEWHSDSRTAQSPGAETYDGADPRVNRVIEEVCRTLEVHPGDLRPGRDPRVGGPARGLALMMLHERFPVWPLKRLGAIVGLDHAGSVLRAIDRAKARMARDSSFRGLGDEVRRRLS